MALIVSWGQQEYYFCDFGIMKCKMVLWAGHEARTGKGKRSRSSSRISVNMLRTWKCL
jgi:hypothetical protein